MDIKKTGHTCETSPEACAQPYLLPDTTLALFWMGRGAAILSSAQMTAEDLVFAVRGLGEAQAAYLQKLIEVCGACDALCECRAARVEETDALRRLPPKLLRELWEKGVCIRNLGRALASGAFLYDARNIRKRGTEHVILTGGYMKQANIQITFRVFNLASNNNITSSLINHFF